MIRRPKSRGISLIASSSLVALMLLVPAGATAATPTVILNGTGPNPATVSLGEPAAFSTSLKNNDTSNISLKLTTTDPSLVVLAATATGGTCQQTTPLSCTFKNVKPQVTVSAAVVLQAPAAGTSFNAQLKWDTTGISNDKGGNSHGDSFYFPNSGVPTVGVPLTVPLNSDATNYRSRYVLTTTQQTVQNDQAVGSANKQATRVVAPSTLIGVTVSDGTAGDACTGCFGEASVVEVAGGAPFSGGFQVIITFDSSEIPSGVNANNINVYHTWTGDPAPGFETISTRCSFSGGLPTSMPCLTAKKVNGNDLQVTIWTTHNGVIHGLG